MPEKTNKILVSSNILLEEPNFVKGKDPVLHAKINEEGIKLDGFS